MNKRNCPVCNEDITNSHRNRRYCSDKCLNKDRYARSGQRSTPDQRKKWYRSRVSDKKYRDKLREQGRRRRDRVQRFIRRYKIMVGCKDCGYKKHHSALDFDHVRGEKQLNVALSKSIAQAKGEIRKCEVVCSNCHRIRTYERLNNND